MRYSRLKFNLLHYFCLIQDWMIDSESVAIQDRTQHINLSSRYVLNTVNFYSHHLILL